MAQYESTYAGAQIDAAVSDAELLRYEKDTEGIDFSKNYLSFLALESGTFKFTNAINYSIYGVDFDWHSLAANTNTPTVSAGQRICFKANITPQPYAGSGKFSSTGKYIAEGNIMSLIYGGNFRDKSNFPNEAPYAGLMGMFQNNTKLVSAKNLILPAKVVYEGGYNSMFQGCTSLIQAPKELPATTLGQFCYNSMFQGCTSLIQAPDILATTDEASFGSMFAYCASLKRVIIRLSKLTQGYHKNWLEGVSEHGVVIVSSTIDGVPFESPNGVPHGWSIATYN